MRRTYELNVTHVFADGRVMTDEEFFRKPYEVVAENNYDFLLKANRVLNPTYEQREHLRRKWERAEARKAELIAQQLAIAKQLNKL